jgi:RNA-directed DNA polymerase
MLIELMSEELQLPITYLQSRAKSASHLYRTYEIHKRGGGSRTIHHPSIELKTLQRWLLHNVIESLPVMEGVVFAYRKKTNVASNAGQHLNSTYLLRMDFTNFFPSLSDEDIRYYIRGNARLFQSWAEGDVRFFSSIVCRFGKLTVGAPSSPSLSNVLCRHMDVEVKKAADELGVTYTRYADDLFFSTNEPKVLSKLEHEVVKIVRKLECPANLHINEKKTRHLSKRQNRQVTGVVLSTDGTLSLGRALKRRIRSMVYHVESLEGVERKRLAGLLAYCKSIEPDFINRLILKFGGHQVRLAQGGSSEIDKRTNK